MAKKKAIQEKDEIKRLSDSEIKTMEVGVLEKQNRSLKEQMKKLEILVTKEQVAKSMIAVELANVKTMYLELQAQCLTQTHSDLDAVYKSKVDRIKESHKIVNEKWGYNPDSGEINDSGG